MASDAGAVGGARAFFREAASPCQRPSTRGAITVDHVCADVGPTLLLSRQGASKALSLAWAFSGSLGQPNFFPLWRKSLFTRRTTLAFGRMGGRFKFAPQFSSGAFQPHGIR